MTIKLALIGCGGIARRHIVAMQDLKNRGLGGFEVTAVCDTSEELAQEKAALLADAFGVRPAIYNDYEKLLAAEQLDGADLCLPHGLHHGVSVACMEAGVHVLCEKPLGITIKACRLMAETAERTGKILSTAAPHRRQPGQRAVQWLFNQSKLIGEPLSFFHCHTRPAEAPAVTQGPLPARVRWRRDRLMSGGGPVLDSGFHYCDSIRYFFGEVDKVYAELRELKTGQARDFQTAPEDTVFITFTFKNGVTGTWTWSLAAQGEPHFNVAFFGSEGALYDTTFGKFSIFHLFERRPDQRESGKLIHKDGRVLTLDEVEALHLATLTPAEREFLFPGGSDDGFAIEIWEFVELIQGKRAKPEIDGWEGLRSLAVGEAVYESALTGEVIQVDEIVSGKRGQFQAPIDAHWGL